MKELDRSVQPPIKTLTSIKIPLPQRKTLTNNIPITIVKAGEEKVLRFDLLFRAGTWCQSQKLQALFTNRMLREGTKRFTSKQIAEKLDFYGSWLELSCGAEYSCITLFSLSRHFTKLLDLLYSIVTEPLFDSEQLEGVVDMNVQQFLINQDRVDFVAQRGLFNVLLGDTHPYGKRTVKEDYYNINSALLKEYHRVHFHSKNCSLFISGDVTDNVLMEIEKVFGATHFGYKEGDTTLCPKPLFSPSSSKRHFIEHANAVQSAVCLGLPTLGRTSPDYHKFRVVLTLLGGYFGSRLVSNIREDKGYTYYIGADTIHYPYSDFLVIHSECDNRYVEKLIGEVYREIEVLQTELVTPQELEKVKNYMAGELCRNYESAFAVADAWMFTFTSKVSDDYFNKALKGILTVTPQDILVLSRKYLDVEKMKEIVAGQK